MISDKNAASAMGGKTARACDNCVRRRARWFCAADDAFLCQSCDASVHSANTLARRHERVRLKMASFRPQNLADIVVPKALPAWTRGFTRKARTPRHRPTNKSGEGSRESPNPGIMVPELGVDDTTSWHEENEEEQLLYRVPVFDPFDATPTGIGNSNFDADSCSNKGLLMGCDYGHDDEMDNLTTSFLQSEMELAEFAADVEVLLGKGLEQECFGMDELGLLGDNFEEHKFSLSDNSNGKSMISAAFKVKDEDGDDDEKAIVRSSNHMFMDLDAVSRDAFDFGFDYEDDSGAGGEEKVEVVVKNDYGESKCGGGEEWEEKKKGNKILLRLDYEGVIVAWKGQGSPWMNGNRPEINPDECWPDCMVGAGGGEVHCSNYEDVGGGGGHGGGSGDGGREARVSRYREKRRTRLFSKKIRYEVRKLNAEKRPRMKGRFVKRASFLGAAAATPFPLLTK